MSQNNKQQKPSILVVDDLAQNSAIITQTLKNDYIVKIVDSGQKALAFLKEDKKVDLILLEALMPNMDGYTLCLILKQDIKFKDIPVIFLTVPENESEVIKGLELGAIDYIIKPVSAHILKARVGTHIKLKQLQDLLREVVHEKDAMLIEQSKIAILGEMLENVVHQWKQPISMISMSSANIKVDMMFGELNTKALSLSLEGIDNSVKYLMQTMNDFRDFFHDNSEADLFDISDIVNQTVELISSKINDYGINLEVDLPHFNLPIFKNDLIQILMNILSNSIEALEKLSSNRLIKISHLKEDDNFKLTICDNGGGISEKNINKIFDKYFTTKKDKIGSGIGLYMCQVLVKKRIGGSIQVFNTQKGACFEILIPLKSEPAIFREKSII